MTRKQGPKGRRGKTISLQFFKAEDSEFRAIAAEMNQSAANAARVLLLPVMAEMRRQKEERHAPVELQEANWK